MLWSPCLFIWTLRHQLRVIVGGGTALSSQWSSRCQPRTGFWRMSYRTGCQLKQMWLIWQAGVVSTFKARMSFLPEALVMCEHELVPFWRQGVSEQCHLPLTGRLVNLRMERLPCWGVLYRFRWVLIAGHVYMRWSVISSCSVALAGLEPLGSSELPGLSVC